MSASPAPEDTQRVPVRLERATLPLTVVASTGLTLALVLGGWFYSQLVAGVQAVAVEVRGLRADMAGIDRRVTVLEAPGLEGRMRDLDRRVTTIEARQQGGQR